VSITGSWKLSESDLFGEGAMVRPRSSQEQLHDEIEKYCRQFLIRLSRAITAAKVEVFRDILDGLADFLDDYSKMLRKTKAKGLGRPPGQLIENTGQAVTAFVGSDSAKWKEVKEWSDACLSFVEHWPAAEDASTPAWTKDQFVKSLS